MLTSDWTTFFGIDIGAATGLAGLLFVAFSIHQSNRPIDPLAQSIGTLFFGEFITSLVMGLAAVLPPHIWWIGALLGSMTQLASWNRTRRMAQLYAIAYRSTIRGKPFSDEQLEHARIYKVHRGQIQTLFVPLCENLLVFGSGAAGALAYFGLLPRIIPTWLPLQIAGTFAAWYLLSATINAWYFLFRLDPTTNAHGRQTASDAE